MKTTARTEGVISFLNLKEKGHGEKREQLWGVSSPILVQDRNSRLGMKLRLVIIRQEVRMRSKMKMAVLVIEIMVPELEMKLNPWAERELLQLLSLVRIGRAHV